MKKTEFLARFHHARNIQSEADYPLRQSPRQAGVLIPLIDYPEGLKVLLTERAHHLKHHPGQISFPGGGAEIQDADLTATALREAWEEIGLPAENVAVIGALADYRTISGYSMRPVVGIVKPGFAMNIDTNEVESVFEVPLKFLMDMNNHFIHHVNKHNYQYPIYFMPWENRMIWGATAAILRNLASHLAME